MKEIAFDDKKLIWIWDNQETSAAQLPLNNLFILDAQGREVWNMKDCVGYDDVCVGMHKVEDDSFYFVTFMGLGFTIDLHRFQVLKKQMTK